MQNSVDFSGRPFHFIGVGGIGMSALACILAQRKLPVSGSDLRSSHITQHLQALGVHIFWRQDATNLQFFYGGEVAQYDRFSSPRMASEGKDVVADQGEAKVASLSLGPSVLAATVSPDEVAASVLASPLGNGCRPQQ
ncbi:MAG TPA: Mur ligase domain-containing protein, partial [Candidatus Caenarcaniphilales bacterium]